MFKRLRNGVLVLAVALGITTTLANPAAAAVYDQPGKVYSTCVSAGKRFSVDTFFNSNGYVDRLRIKSTTSGYHTLIQWWNGPSGTPINGYWRSVEPGHRRYMAAETWYWWYPEHVVTGYHRYMGSFKYYGSRVTIDFNSSSATSAHIDCGATANTSNYYFN